MNIKVKLIDPSMNVELNQGVLVTIGIVLIIDNEQVTCLRVGKIWRFWTGEDKNIELNKFSLIEKEEIFNFITNTIHYEQLANETFV